MRASRVFEQKSSLCACGRPHSSPPSSPSLPSPALFLATPAVLDSACVCTVRVSSCLFLLALVAACFSYHFLKKKRKKRVGLSVLNNATSPAPSSQPTNNRQYAVRTTHGAAVCACAANPDAPAPVGGERVHVTGDLEFGASAAPALPVVLASANDAGIANASCIAAVVIVAPRCVSVADAFAYSYRA